MIGYSFLEEEEIIPKRQIYKRPPRRQHGLVARENTECNYLVMFFIVGVLILVLSDQIK